MSQIVSSLERISVPKLMEANKAVFDLLVNGVLVPGDRKTAGGRDRTARVIDFENPERNDFLAINQFRVDVSGGKTFIAHDLMRCRGVIP